MNYYSSFSSYSMDSDGNKFESNINTNNGEGRIYVKKGDDVLINDRFKSQDELNLNRLIDFINNSLGIRRYIAEEIDELEYDLEEVFENEDLDDAAVGILERIDDNEKRIADIDYDLGIAESAVGIHREASDISFPESGMAKAAAEIHSPSN